MNHTNEQNDLLQKLLSYSDRQHLLPSAAANENVLTDLVYLNRDNKVRFMDLYLPEEAKAPIPVILDVHGGAWIHGSKETNGAFASYLSSKGFAVLVIDYTAAKDGDLPNQVDDILSALRWLWKKADQYAFDRERIFLCGDSAGAHLAVLSYIVGHNPTLQLIYGVQPLPFSVKGIGLLSPVCDLHFFTDSVLPAQRAFRKRLFGERYADSPLRYCASIPDILRTSTTLPPVYLASSEDDFFRSQSIHLHHVLNRRNVPNQFRYYPAGKTQTLPHSFSVHHPELAESRAVNDEMLRFFSRL